MGRLSRRQAPSPGLRRVSSLCLPVTVCEALESSDWTVGWQPVGVAKGGPMATALLSFPPSLTWSSRFAGFAF